MNPGPGWEEPRFEFVALAYGPVATREEATSQPGCGLDLFFIKKRPPCRLMGSEHDALEQAQPPRQIMLLTGWTELSQRLR